MLITIGALPIGCERTTLILASDGPFGEAEHVGALGALGAAAFVGRELAVGVDLALETVEELLAGWAGADALVFGAAPLDFGRYPLVDVLGGYGTLSPRLSHYVIVSVVVSSSAFARLRADTRETADETFVRQLLVVRLLGGDRASDPGRPVPRDPPGHAGPGASTGPGGSCR
jgi:hypothetical protein